MRHWMALNLSAAFFTVISPLLAVHASRPSIVLPVLPDSPPVGATVLALKDKTRLDPFTNNTRHREVMLSIFYPTDLDLSRILSQRPMSGESKPSLMPYMPPATAAIYDSVFAEYGLPVGTFSSLFTRCHLNAPVSTRTAHPLLVFSPGGGTSRFFYTTIMEELARRGYVVAVVDHPYDALVVEFPDGRLIRNQGKELDRELVELLVDTRAKDVSFVLDSLESLSDDIAVTINTSNAIAFGHSLGGATAAEAMLNDTRIKGGINFDGRLFGSMERPNVTLSKPFLQFASEFSTTRPYWHWDQAWQHLAAWKLELSLDGSQHATFSDLPLLGEATRLKEMLGEEGEALFGTVDGLRGVEIMAAYVDAFAEYVFEGKNGTLLDGERHRSFVEVTTVRRGGS